MLSNFNLESKLNLHERATPLFKANNNIWYRYLDPSPGANTRNFDSQPLPNELHLSQVTDVAESHN